MTDADRVVLHQLLNKSARDWPTLRQQVKQMAKTARGRKLGLQTRFVMADRAGDLAQALARTGEDVRWLERYCIAVYWRVHAERRNLRRERRRLAGDLDVERQADGIRRRLRG